MSAWEGSAWQQAQEQERERRKAEAERLAKMTPEQRARYRGVPMLPKIPERPAVEANPIVAVCGECGRDIREFESYVCGKSRCPAKLDLDSLQATGALPYDPPIPVKE